MDPEATPTADFEQMLALASIGNYVVSAGHLEVTICRVVEWLSGNQNSGQITVKTLNLPWDGLVSALRDRATAAGIGPEVEELLVRYGLPDLVALRHSLVHGSVDLSGSAGSIVVIRRPRKGKSSIMLGSRDQVNQYTAQLHGLMGSLDRLMPTDYRRFGKQPRVEAVMKDDDAME